jgi:PAS domain S-box-containing protein
MTTIPPDTEGGRSESALLERRIAELEQRIHELHTENLYLRELYDRAPLGYQSLDAAGAFIEVNQAWLETLGYDREEVLGRNFGDFLHPDWKDHFRENFPRFKALGEIMGVEFEMRRKDGSIVHVSFNGKVGRDAAGEFKQTYCIFQDITWQRRTEEALQDSEEKWRNIIMTTPQVGIGIDPDGRIVFANTHFLKLTGWSEEEILGRDWFDTFIPAGIREEIRGVFVTVMRQKATIGLSTYENQILTRSGELRNIAWSNALSTDIHGNIVDVICLGVDLTERQQAMETLRQSEERYRSYIDNAPYGIFVADERGRYRQVNPSACRITGYSEEELLSMGIGDMVFPEDLQAAMSDFSALTTSGIINREYAYRTKSGERRWWTLKAVKLSDCRFMGFVNDITDRKEAETRLLASQSRHRAIVMTSMDGFWMVDARGRLLEVNETYCRMSGYSEAELLTMTIGDLDAEETAAQTSEHMQQLLAVGSGSFESRHRRKDGTLFDVEVRVQISPTEPGELVVFLRDITEQKGAQMALRESEERYRALHNASFGGIAVHDRGVILECNQGLAEITGYAVEELVGMDGLLLIAPDARGLVMQNILSGYEKPYEATGLRKNGEEYPLRLEARKIPYRGSQVRSVEFRDITDARQAEIDRQLLQEQLLQAQKMETVGRLAGGVAHDFNNMLGVILGRTEMADERLADDHPAREDLAEIRKAAERSVNLTRQLLAFARKQTIAPKVMDLNEAVAGMLKMVRRLIGEDIDLVWLPSAGLWSVKIDPSQLDQILANLCVNARDAINGVGKVTIETENRVFDAAYCSVHRGFIPGEYVQLALSDDGCGMDREVLSHLFEPFFTTKEPGKGTGLGLATVYGIVKQNDGFINVYSEPGQGTTFKVFLPRHLAGRQPLPVTGDKEEAVGGHECILVVEDEPAILNLICTMLERLGYTVLAASSPTEALETVESCDRPITLLLTDVIMPEMNGRELSNRVKALRPEVLTLFMSGYTANTIAHHGVLDQGVEFIEKPFFKKDLAAKIREVLQRSGR